MRVVTVRTLHGPNIYLHRPVVLMRVDLEELRETETRAIDGFNERLIALLPGLGNHHCSPRRPGGFLERLREGTYLGHVTEHIALELSDLAGMTASFGKTVAGDRDGIYDIVVEFESERGMRHLLRGAVTMVNTLVRGEPFDPAPLLAEAGRLARQFALGPSTRSIVEAAARQNIPWRQLSEGSSMIEFGYGRYRRRIQAAATDRTSALAVDIAGDKQLAKAVLSEAALPVPNGCEVYSLDEALEAMEEIRKPLVVKPLDGNQGNGVSLEITTAEQLRRAYEEARRFSSRILIEEQIAGDDYRVLVINGRMAAASRRYPAHVTGDGVSTVRELIDRENSREERGEEHERPLTRMRLDDVVLCNLSRQNMTPDTVPEADRRVLLQQTANLSTGGTAEDVTDIIHRDIIRICERASRLIGLDICGIDLVLRDIRRPLDRENGCIIEVNASPGLRMHVYPTAGTPRDVGAEVIRMLYPPGAPSRIPIIAITGTNGKTTVTRMIGHMLRGAGRSVGMTTTDGIEINGRQVARGDLTGARSARSVLSDPGVEVAVLETARGGIVRSGLGYDWADIGVITSIQPDHIGQDGIRSLDDIVFIKSLVAERVRAGGTIVLNLDDPRVRALRDIPRVRENDHRFVYFTLHDDGETLRHCRAVNETVYFLRDGWIVEARGLQEQRIVHLEMLPFVMGGLADYNTANAMAAVAAARAYGLSQEQVTVSLMGFTAETHNRGRGNVYRISQGYVMLDYGHNAAAIEAVARFSASTGMRITAVIGLPGDRADWILEEAARIAARGFHRIIIREDGDLRGRAQGALPALIERVVRQEAPEKECCVIPGTVEAMRMALDTMHPGELVVVFYEEFDEAFDLLQQYGPVPAITMGAGRGILARSAI